MATIAARLLPLSSDKYLPHFYNKLVALLQSTDDSTTLFLPCHKQTRVMNAVTQQQLSLKNTAIKFMFAYQQRSIEKMLSLCEPEGTVLFVPLGENGKGRIGELGKNLWTALIECFPDIDNTLDAAVAENENTVRCQVVIRGTQARDFAGITNKGFQFESDHIFVFHLNEAGKIDSIQVEWDHQDFQRQLGS